MSKSIVSKKVTTCVFRVAFPQVFEPNEDDKFGLAMLFDKETANMAWFKDIVGEVTQKVQAELGGALPANFRGTPLKDGDIPSEAGTVYNGFPGNWVVNTYSKFKPGIVDSYIDPQTQRLKDITDKNEFYPGCYARATVHAYSYDYRGKRGISISLNNIQKVKDGDSLGGGTPASQDFEPIEADNIPAPVAQESTNPTNQSVPDISDL